MIILDSNVWVALFNEEDSLAEQARKVLQQNAPGILLPEYILIETCSVLKKRKHHQVAIQFLDRVLNNADIKFFYSSASLLKETVSLFSSQNLTNLSFIDVSLLFLSQYYTVITFDKKLESAIKKQVG